MVAGLDRAMGDFVFEFDDTFMDYPFEVLDRMYDSAVSGFDVVAAAPDHLGWGLRSFYAVCNWFSGIQPPLSYERLRVSSRRALDAMLHQRERIRDRQVLYRYTGYRYLRLDYPADRTAGHHPRTSLRFGLDVFFSFTDAGVRISRAFFLFFAAVSALSIVASFFAVHQRQGDALGAGLTSIIAAGFAGLYFVLAVVGEYAARILAEVRSRPIYTMDKTLTWTMTPTETQRVPSGIPTQERVEAQVEQEPFMVRQRRESAEYLREKRTDGARRPSRRTRPALHDDWPSRARGPRSSKGCSRWSRTRRSSPWVVTRTTPSGWTSPPSSTSPRSRSTSNVTCSPRACASRKRWHSRTSRRRHAVSRSTSRASSASASTC